VLVHLGLQFLQLCLRMMHDNFLDELACLVLKLHWDHICCSFVHDDFDASEGYLVHVLEAGWLIAGEEFEGKLEDCFVLGVVTLEWDLLENGVDKLWVLYRALLGRQWHQLELDDAAGGRNDVVLSVYLGGVGVQL